MKYRFATLDDVPLLARMNKQLVEDEQHRNRFKSEEWFAERMRGFLAGEYRAVLFEIEAAVVGYALYRNHPEHGDTIYLRQIFVDRAHRRQGIGKRALRLLKEEILPPGKRRVVEVLVGNHAAREFYRAAGFHEYSLELEIPPGGIKMSRIRVMSFNIRYGTADDGENRWARRKELVIDRIRSFDPDLIGLQECRADAQAEYVKNNLPAYQFIGVRRGGNDETTLEMTPLLYKKTIFEEIARGNFWLSETPDVPGSKSWGSAFPRTAIWIKLHSKTSDATLAFLNTHFDHRSKIALEQSADLVYAWAQKLAPDCAVIVTGDFNADKNTPAYRRLTRGALYDVYRRAHPDEDAAATYHGYGKPGAQSAIDWILASEHFETREAEIDRFNERGAYPSDHFPLTAILELKED